ncbi:uncharacterized protein N7459_001703 [Penicillium hispanicum]|uniref:uncharacterized protein n=1 Tax=Penicillium hispanicum TaxID=1080232 RepID=UPI00253FC953|nr:uncharacterized protein N7459_001703 [Penicillium hispanicum]KAJ5595495.1 hypothetical protein N7459_001703 [Penicillium hispanicum]
MPPLTNHHRRHDSQSTTYPRASILPSSASATFRPDMTATGPASTNPGNAGLGTHYQSSTPSMSAAKTRQYAHLHSQLAQLNANLADTENLLRMTAVQAGDMRFLGGYVGALFMGSAKVLGEEGVKGNADEVLEKKNWERQEGVVKKEDSEEED